MRQGDYVHLSVEADDINASSVPFTLRNADGETVTLQSHQRLLIAELVFAVEEVGTGDEQSVYVHTSGASPYSFVAVTAASPFTQAVQYNPEYLSGRLGEVPLVGTESAGQVRVSGVGYIVNATEGNVRPSYREDLNKPTAS
jgi:hypothetical protein